MKALLKQLRLPPIKYNIIVILFSFLASTSLINAQTSITQIEYFFGTDQGIGTGTMVTADTNTGELTQSLSLPTTGLNGGFQNLTIRAQDDQGNWSLYDRRVFYVIDDIGISASGPASNLAGAEYWFDDNAGNSQPLTISGSPSSTTESYVIPIGSLDAGFHNLTIRVQNEDLNWSLYDRRVFYVIDDEGIGGGGPISNLAGAEYWFDDDSSNPVALAISGSPSSTLESYVIPIGSLDAGFHNLTIRVQNEDDAWSLYDRRVFYVIDDEGIGGGGALSNLAGAEYWFDTDPGPGNGTTLTISGSPISTTQNFIIPLNDLGAGFHKLGMRAKNENGDWSLYDKRAFYIFENSNEGAASPLTEAEVLFNADLGFGTGNAVAITATGNPDEYAIEIPSDLALCGISNLTLSVKNADGGYSLFHTLTDIEITDAAPPTIVVFEDITVVLDENGEATLTINEVNNGTFDDCELVSVVLNQPQFDYTPVNIGSDNKVTITATDAVGKESTLEVTITVVDNSAKDWYLDADGDNFASAILIQGEDPGPDYTLTVLPVTDCDDTNANINPDAPEICDGLDNDCNSLIDNTDPNITDQGTWYIDADGDTYGDTLATGVLNCNQPDNYVLNNLDCDDSNSAIYPGASEIADNDIDEDCDGFDALTWFADADNDSYGNTNISQLANTQPSGYVSNNNDCNDTNPNVNPGATEIPYDGLDNDCNPATRDDDLDEDGYVNAIDCDDNDPNVNAATTYYVDNDGDGFGAAAENLCSTTAVPNGYASVGGDCNDNNAAINPNATEVTNNGVDDDCNPATPDSTGGTGNDNDDDGDGYSENQGDCNDTNPNVNPGATEVPYDGVDNDCDPTTLDDDLDEDGFVFANDCNDGNSAINPDATEICDGVDNNCDGQTDENFDFILFYADNDGDGFGNNEDEGALYCENPGELFSSNNNDCDDGDAAINPDATEIQNNGIDDDCNPETPDSALDTDDDGDGFTENEGDCDDNDPDINPSAQIFNFSSNPGFTASIVNPSVGAPTDDYNIEVIFTDTRNVIPQFGYPRVIFDYDADGVFNTANDKTIVLTEGNATDTNIADGKLYVGTISPLEANTEYEIFTEVVIDGCSTIFGPFDAPDVLTQSDIEIFANDIVFSNPNPDPSSLLQITATIHNESDLPAENFFVGLLNEWDPTIVYPDSEQLVPYIGPNSSTQVVWNIITPDEIGWMPMRVSIDITDVIEESNELDNNAVRPFTNGDYNVPGTIEVDVNVTPSIVNINYPSVRVSGYAYYDDTAVPLTDPSVAGATVDIFVEDLNRTIQVHTDSNGIFSTSFSASNNVGTYTVSAEVTDYTLTGVGSDTFEIVYSPITDWAISVTYDDNSILEGETTSGQITISNNGDQNLPQTTVDFLQNGGVPLLPNSYIVPALMENESHVIDLGDMTFATAGRYSIRGTVNPNNAVLEAYTSNNTSIDYLSVLVGLPDLIPWAGPNTSSFYCNSNLTPTFSVRNAGNVPATNFDVEVDIYEGSTFISTETHTVSGLNNGQSVSFSLAYTYPSEGNYNFDVRVDVPIASNGSVIELRENNNIASYSRTLLECKPDLTVSGCGGDMVVEPIDPGDEAMNTYRTAVTNSGNATATAPFDVRFQVVGGASSTVTVLDDLAPGASASVEVEMPFAGNDKELIVTADIDAIITELHETNNSNSSQLCHEFYLTPPCGASGDQFWGTNQFIQFSTVVPWIKLHNQYLYAASNVDVKFEVQTPSSVGFIELSQESEENILGCHAGCSLSRSYVMNNSFVFSETGSYTFRWTADSDGDYQECDETNNVYIRTINVKNLPDMRVLSQFINPDILNPAVGEDVSFDITYENIAFPNTGEEMDFDIYVDEVLLERIENVSGLLSNTNNTLSVTAPWASTTAGAHIVRIIIDSNGEIIETNELNNEATRAIIIGEASNLYFKEFGVDDEFPVIPQFIQINGVVENNGDIDVDAEVEFYYIDNNGQEQYLGKQDISVAAGTEVTVNYNWNVSVTETTIIGRIVNPSVIEFDENDNEASTDIGDGLSVSFDTTQACEATEELGSATANATGESGNYSYEWNTGETTQTINKPAGTYIVTVNDTDTDEMVEISITIIQDEECIDYCPDDDDKIYPGICGCGTPDIDTDGDGIADCDDAEVNSPCPDDVDENGVSSDDCIPDSSDTDDDGDGFTENEGDCDDTNPNVNPAATETPYDGVDNDCNPATLDDDLDEDGFLLANDCNDNDDTVNATTTYYVDNDGDGYGTTAEDICSATAQPGYADVDGDCDDNNSNINPGAAEVIDGIDNNCNGSVDEGFTDADGDGYAAEIDDCDDTNPDINPETIWYADNDGDGYGDSAQALTQCLQPANHVLDNTDCDDNNININPGATEVIDGIDNNCNGSVDEGFTDADGDGYAAEIDDCDDTNPDINPETIWYAGVDDDGDNFFGSEITATQCESPGNEYATTPVTVDDCDDDDANINPDTIWYAGVDDDGDNFFGSEITATQCESPGNEYATNPVTVDDCDDNDATLNPDTIWYAGFDGDGDNFFGSEITVTQCESPGNEYATNPVSVDDCDDDNAAVNPGETEIVNNNIDDDCDPSTPDVEVSERYVWTGNSDTDWTNIDNWENNNAPGLSPSEDVSIPSGSTNYPQLSVDLNLDEDISLTVDDGAALNINPNIVVTNDGIIINNGVITFESDATGSAYIGSGTGSFVGDVTIERYIPAKRAFRQLSTPVTTSSFIENNWQQSGSTQPGQGTHITGSTTGANGFDITGTGNPSMYTFDNTSYSYVPLANTDATNLVPGTMYHILVRGDRNTDLANNNAAPSETTLTSIGVLTAENNGSGTIAVDVPEQRFIAVGNPLQAPVNMQEVLSEENSNNINPYYYYVWDPNLNTRGGYASIFMEGGSTVTSPGSSNANNFLQAGQAGWAYTSEYIDDNGTMPASIRFTQASKATSELETGVFKVSKTKTNTALLRLSLYESSALASNKSAADGLVILFDNEGDNTVDSQDARKFTNLDENFATNNNGTLLSIENRAIPMDSEEVPLEINTYRHTNYTIVAEAILTDGIKAYLYDKYTGVSTEILQTGSINYAYSVDFNSADSMASDRFKINFSSVSLSSVVPDVDHIKLYPNPSNIGKFYLNIPVGMDDLEVTIYNVLGAELFYKTGFKAGTRATIKTDFTQNQAIYLVKLSSQGKTTTKKFTIN